MISRIAPAGQLLLDEQITSALAEGLSGRFDGKKVLVLIPDHTRTLPLPFLFKTLVPLLAGAKKLDFMVALGTHPAIEEEGLLKLVGITAQERSTIYSHVGILNHAWQDPAALTTLGTLDASQVKQIAGDRWHPSLPETVDVKLNKAALACDEILIVGPTFPHEVVGFSGGAKYLFPGISGSDMINATHWLGALAGVVGTIGVKDTPVRAMIHAAADLLPTPLTLLALVVEGHGLAGLFLGEHTSAWSAAADLSAQRHIRWCPKPFRRVLSCAPPMYDELWTAAKAMYKIEPAVALGGEVVIYAPHLKDVSFVHGEFIQQVGYHILPYFLSDWERFRSFPLGVLAHSTHVRGSGVMQDGIEKPNVRVTLASQIPEATCRQLQLGYMDPASLRIDEWKDREDEGILYVPKAGEILYRCDS